MALLSSVNFLADILSLFIQERHIKDGGFDGSVLKVLLWYKEIPNSGHAWTRRLKTFLPVKWEWGLVGELPVDLRGELHLA